MEDKKIKFILSLFIFCLIGVGFLYFFEHQGYAQPGFDTLTDYFDTSNPGGNPEYYIASEESLTISGGQVQLISCLANGGSCSSDAVCCSNICGTDDDSDNYFSQSAGHTGTCQATTHPYTDCYDSNANVHPGQNSYFTSHRGDGSFDYNCDGAEERYYTLVSTLTGSWQCVTEKPTGLCGLWNADDLANCGDGDQVFLKVCEGYHYSNCAGGASVSTYGQPCPSGYFGYGWKVTNSNSIYTQKCR